MSKIISVRAIPLSFKLPEDRQITVGIGTTTKRDAIIVRVETEDGVVGYGEAHPGRSPGAVCSLIDSTLAPAVVGMDAFDSTGIWDKLYKMQIASHGLGTGAALAISGIDMAVWDARGKLCNVPLYKLLGGSNKPIKAYAGGISMGFQPPESLAEEVMRYVARGYKAVKLRFGDTVAKDVARMRLVRQTVGEELEVLADINAAYDLEQVRRLVPAIEECRLGWLEEPFGCNNHGAYRSLKSIMGLVPIAAGENHYTRYAFAQLLEAGAVQIFQPDVSKTGGVTETMRIAALLSAWGYQIHPHSSATGLNHAACLHILAAVDNAGYFEACVSDYNPFRDMFGELPPIDANGNVRPPEGPGLGFEVDEDLFRKYPLIDGPGYVR
ncbi:mandelate racemase/muconate lactonizing enzyme family protein [Imbroritus primus]|uniref:Mandelate racemase/muconate lactonizing enzyme family protein n=1 Tax=Imbroritus primus TaxID=3058603 RepID=A0ACD3SKB5_9BURK|nr:mandelate racemase/muconate lactonizing enzyme family protein [Burkholderiaceae bacterium PBA]